MGHGVQRQTTSTGGGGSVKGQDPQETGRFQLKQVGEVMAKEVEGIVELAGSD